MTYEETRNIIGNFFEGKARERYERLAQENLKDHIVRINEIVNQAAKSEIDKQSISFFCGQIMSGVYKEEFKNLISKLRGAE